MHRLRMLPAALLLCLSACDDGTSPPDDDEPAGCRNVCGDLVVDELVVSGDVAPTDGAILVGVGDSIVLRWTLHNAAVEASNAGWFRICASQSGDDCTHELAMRPVPTLEPDAEFTDSVRTTIPGIAEFAGSSAYIVAGIHVLDESAMNNEVSQALVLVHSELALELLRLDSAVTNGDTSLVSVRVTNQAERGTAYGRVALCTAAPSAGCRSLLIFTLGAGQSLLLDPLEWRVSYSPVLDDVAFSLGATVCVQLMAAELPDDPSDNCAAERDVTIRPNLAMTCEHAHVGPTTQIAGNLYGMNCDLNAVADPFVIEYSGPPGTAAVRLDWYSRTMSVMVLAQDGTPIVEPVTVAAGDRLEFPVTDEYRYLVAWDSLGFGESYSFSFSRP